MDPKLDPGTPPLNWRQAAADLVAARLELIRLESQIAIKTLVAKAIWGGVLAVALLFAWPFLLVGGIVLLAHATGVAWTYLALATGGLHLVVGLVALTKLRRPAPTGFPHTKAEFQRDREWLKTLNPPKSKP